jgi:hypothetical protein
VRPSTRSWWRSARFNLLLVLGVGCSASELPTAPTYTYLTITAHTTGGDLDLDGYKAVVDGEERGLLWGGLPASMLVDPGTHSVALNDVAANCTVGGTTTRSVTVQNGEAVDVTFEIACVGTGLTVTTSTAGSDTPDSIQVVLSGQQEYRSAYWIAKTARLDVGRLEPGSYTVAVVVPENCTVSGGAPVAVAVVAGAVAAVPAFQIACAPAVRSPRIAYVSRDYTYQATRPTIESIRLDGSARTFISVGDAPAWSADGTKLAFSAGDCLATAPWDYGDDCSGQLELLDPETGNHSIPSAAERGFRPAWAPTGDAIAFELREYTGGPAVIRMMRTADSSIAEVSVGGPEPSSLEQPAWSPDGARLAVTCTWLSHMDLCLVNRDGSGLVHLTNDDLADSDPAWSPDGKRIAFTRRGADPSNRASDDVALFDLATGVITLLTKGSDPTWSPDGSKLAFAGSDGIFIVNADGTNRTRLTSGAHTAPAWRPQDRP